MDCLNKNRAEAIKNNESKYFNEIPCKNGGVGIKTIHGRCLCEICNKIRYEKLKAYRKLNPQKHGKQSKVWAEKNKEKVSKYQKEWKATNKEKINLNKKYSSTKIPKNIYKNLNFINNMDPIFI